MEKITMGIYRVWTAGTDTLVITIDKHTREALGIKDGSFLSIPEMKRVEPPIEENKEESKTDKEVEVKRKKATFK